MRKCGYLVFDWKMGQSGMMELFETISESNVGPSFILHGNCFGNDNRDGGYGSNDCYRRKRTRDSCIGYAFPIWSLLRVGIYGSYLGNTCSSLCFQDVTLTRLQVYGPEILPLAHRAKGEGLATACLWLSTFVVVEIVPVAIANIGWKVYLIFACFNLAFIPFIYFFLPEVCPFAFNTGIHDWGSHCSDSLNLRLDSWS